MSVFLRAKDPAMVAYSRLSLLALAAALCLLASRTHADTVVVKLTTEAVTGPLPPDLVSFSIEVGTGGQGGLGGAAYCTPLRSSRETHTPNTHCACHVRVVLWWGAYRALSGIQHLADLPVQRHGPPTVVGQPPEPAAGYRAPGCGGPGAQYSSAWSGHVGFIMRVVCARFLSQQ